MSSLEAAAAKHLSKKHEGSVIRLVLAAVCAYLGPLSFGYTIGYSSPAIPALLRLGLLSQSMTGWFGSVMTLGAMAGGPAAGWLIEKIGRKKTIGVASLPYISGWLCIASADGIGLLLLGRILSGLASGMVTVCAPVYIAEISTSAMRGTLGTGVQLSITIGILIANGAGVYLSWSTLALLGLILGCLMALSTGLIPETPRWLLMQGRKSEAVRSLGQLRDAHSDVEDECRDIEEGLDVNETFSWSEFKKPELFRPLIISVTIMVFQQFSGINAVMFYTVSIINVAGIQNSELAAVLVAGVQVVATFVACLVMDRVGRRRLLILAGSLMCLACFMFGLYYHKMSGVAAGSANPNLGSLAVASLVLYIIGFSLGWGPIPMLIMSEIFPSRARGAASGLAALTNWTCAFIVTKEFLYLQDTAGPATTFWCFALVCLTSVLYVWKKVPETKGKSLEDIELFFLGKSMMHA